MDRYRHQFMSFTPETVSENAVEELPTSSQVLKRKRVTLTLTLSFVRLAVNVLGEVEDSHSQVEHNGAALLLKISILNFSKTAQREVIEHKRQIYMTVFAAF